VSRRPHLVPCLIAAAVLLGALGGWPYGYYTLLRWVTCAAAVFVAVAVYDWKRTAWVWVFGFVAVLFNPLVPVHLSREIWQPIDVVTAVLFTAAALALSRPPSN
jgi:hypothetical protein